MNFKLNCWSRFYPRQLAHYSATSVLMIVWQGLRLLKIHFVEILIHLKNHFSFYKEIISIHSPNTSSYFFLHQNTLHSSLHQQQHSSLPATIIISALKEFCYKKDLMNDNFIIIISIQSNFPPSASFFRFPSKRPFHPGAITTASPSTHFTPFSLFYSDSILNHKKLHKLFASSSFPTKHSLSAATHSH